MKIELQRVYEEPINSKGYRVLVDRLWPRGISKEKANLDFWAKSIAPSNQLRQWIHNNMARWTEFEIRYRKELESLSLEHFEFLNELNQEDTLILLYGSKNKLQNHAVVLKDFIIESQLV